MRSVLIESHQPSLYIARLPIVSKYCWVWRSGASASVSESAKVSPCIGCCSIPSMWVGIGIPAMSRIVGPTSVTWVKCARRAPPLSDRVRPVGHERIAGSAEVRAHLLSPLERRVARPRPGGRVVGRHHLVPPRLDPAVALGELQLHLVGQRDAVLHRQLVERAGDRALHAGAVVAPDPEARACCPARRARRSRRSPGRRCSRRSRNSRRRPPSAARRYALSFSGTSSQAGNASSRSVSSASGGMTPSSFCLAKVSSRSLSQPWSNLPLYFSAHFSATWCGAWLQPVEK